MRPRRTPEQNPARSFYRPRYEPRRRSLPNKQPRQLFLLGDFPILLPKTALPTRSCGNDCAASVLACRTRSERNDAGANKRTQVPCTSHKSEGTVIDIYEVDAARSSTSCVNAFEMYLP